MKRSSVIWILGSTVAVILFAIVGFLRAMDSVEIISTTASPDGHWVASVFSDDCGAACGLPVYGIAITRKAQNYLDADEIIYTKTGDDSLNVIWTSNTSLRVISSDRTWKTDGLKRYSLNGIMIHYGD